MSHAQHSKEGFIREQEDLSARIQEYKRTINQESKWLLSGSHQSSNGDVTQPVPRSSQKEIEAVMQSTSEGKVLKDYLSSLQSNQLSFVLYSNVCVGVLNFLIFS